MITKHRRAVLSHELRTAAHQTIPTGLSGIVAGTGKPGVGDGPHRPPHPMHLTVVAVVRQTTLPMIDDLGSDQRN
ncbi:hypothetical protein [Williamsia muralis]|uniref:Uncharacterized protein n=1 Tax=Williamsia marianensis TaxID=85044 RepID=A0ABU4EW44_WILMA|nr:hypothetical protein [Williamsia muralis]MDV7134864.1 hypothetical protein [Williamsia muralis]